jgi:hypothetical protein
MSENFQQLEKAMKQKMTKLIIERLNLSIRSSLNANVNTTKNISTNTAKAQSNSNSKKIETVRKSQTIRKSQSSEKCRATTESHTSTTSSTWAEVVSKNIIKFTNQKIKAQSAKLNETIQWKSRRMIMFPKNSVLEINSTECRDRKNE